MDWHMSRRMARWSIACIWLFALCVSLPWAFFFKLIPYPMDYNGTSAQANYLSAASDNSSQATSGNNSSSESSDLQNQQDPNMNVNVNMYINVCAEEWPSDRMGELYFIGANLILLYLLPALVIIICYLGIWYKIERRNIPGDRPQGLKIELIMQKSKLKVVKMMMVVVVSFLLSWLPLYLIWARIKLAQDRSSWEDWLIPNLMPLAQW